METGAWLRSVPDVASSHSRSEQNQSFFVEGYELPEFCLKISQPLCIPSALRGAECCDLMGTAFCGETWGVSAFREEFVEQFLCSNKTYS